MPKLRIILDKVPGMAIKRPGSKIIATNQNGYTPKMGDEKRFVNMHLVRKFDDPYGNGDDVYGGPDQKTVKYFGRHKNRFGYDPDMDQDVEFVADKSRTHQHVATEGEQLDEISQDKADAYLPRAKKSLTFNKVKSSLGSKTGARKVRNREVGIARAEPRATKYTTRVVPPKEHPSMIISNPGPHDKLETVKDRSHNYYNQSKFHGPTLQQKAEAAKAAKAAKRTTKTKTAKAVTPPTAKPPRKSRAKVIPPTHMEPDKNGVMRARVNFKSAGATRKVDEQCLTEISKGLATRYMAGRAPQLAKTYDTLTRYADLVHKGHSPSPKGMDAFQQGNQRAANMAAGIHNASHRVLDDKYYNKLGKKAERKAAKTRKDNANHITAEEFFTEWGKYAGKPLAISKGDVALSTKGNADKQNLGGHSNDNKAPFKKTTKKKPVTDNSEQITRGNYSLSGGTGQLDGGLHEMLNEYTSVGEAKKCGQEIADYHMEPCFIHTYKNRDGDDRYHVIRKKHYDQDDSRFYGYNLTHVIPPTPPKPIKWNKSSRKIAAMEDEDFNGEELIEISKKKLNKYQHDESEEFDEAKKPSALQRFYEKKYKAAGGSQMGPANLGNLSAITNECDGLQGTWPTANPTTSTHQARSTQSQKPGKKIKICTRFSKEMRPGNIGPLGAPGNPGTSTHGYAEEELYERRRFLGKRSRVNISKALRHADEHPTTRQTVEDEDFLAEKLDLSDPAGTYIHHFVHSKNKKFNGKDKAERIRMALGAFYHNKRKGGQK